MQKIELVQMFDVDGYVGRVGLTGRPTIAELHRAHVGAIPFENLDPHRGVPVALDEESLVRKMVDGRRGGYCFEQNLLFKAALEAIGAGLSRCSPACAGTHRPMSCGP